MKHEFDSTDPRTWSSTTRRHVGEALRCGVARLSKSARQALCRRGIIVKGDADDSEVLAPAAADGYQRWLRNQPNRFSGCV